MYVPTVSEVSIIGDEATGNFSRSAKSLYGASQSLWHQTQAPRHGIFLRSVAITDKPLRKMYAVLY